MEGLPNDLLRQILLMLRLDVIRQCFRVCKKWLKVTKHTNFWITLSKRFGFSLPLENRLPWKKARDLFKQFLSDDLLHAQNFNDVNIDVLDKRKSDKNPHEEMVFVRPTFNDGPVLRQVIIFTPFMTNMYIDDENLYGWWLNIESKHSDKAFLNFLASLSKKLDVEELDLSNYSFIAEFEDDEFQVHYKNKDQIETWGINSLTNKGARHNNEILREHSGCYMTVKLESLTSHDFTWKLLRLYLI